MNCSDAIDVSLSFKTYKILVWPGHLEVLGLKTLGTKCIRTLMYNMLANHDQNLESRFRLLKVCLCVKLELSDYRIY